MALMAPSFLPYARRDAYEPSDPMAYLTLQQLRCVRIADQDLSTLKDPLCSLCREVLLGEPLLDDENQVTEYRIAFYELPCGHLRCCSCALKWLDTAGIFHRICQPCDSRKLNIEPDLTVARDFINLKAKVDLPGTWTDGVYDPGPQNLSPISTDRSPIILPAIGEVQYDDGPDTPSKLDLSALVFQTPAPKRRRLDLRGPYPSSIDLHGTPGPDEYIWTSHARRERDVIDDLESATFPEEHNSPSAMRAKADKLRVWAARGKRKSDGEVDEVEEEGEGEAALGEVREESRTRKKPRYAR
ncbi:MAG: hypothetical protein Q9197_000334 [Variospora fuerteventurae]